MFAGLQGTPNVHPLHPHQSKFNNKCIFLSFVPYFYGQTNRWMVSSRRPRTPTTPETIWDQYRRWKDFVSGNFTHRVTYSTTEIICFFSKSAIFLFEKPIYYQITGFLRSIFSFCCLKFKEVAFTSFIYVLNNLISGPVMSSLWDGQLDGPPAADRARQHVWLQTYQLARYGTQQPG